MSTWMCSADGHLIEPRDVWVSRVPSSLRDRAPRYEYGDGNIEYWVEGHLLNRMSTAVMALPDGTLPSPEPDEQLKLLEADGIWAETFLGNLAGRAIFGSIQDAALSLACARAYNDYLHETFGQVADRLIGLAVIPVDDIPAAVGEIDRVAALGFRGITLPVIPPTPYYLEEYEPIWTAAAAHGVPISFHAHTGSAGTIARLKAAAEVPDVPQAKDGVKTVSALIEANQAYETCASLIGAGVLDRYPDLHFVFVECSAGWLAPAMAAMDYVWAPAPGSERAEEFVSIDDAGEVVPVEATAFLGGGWRYPLRPSEYVRRQVHVTFMDEPAPIAFREFTGIEPLLWGSDFPHPEGTWPYSKKITEDLLRGVPDDERTAILGGTFAALYGVDVPAG